MEEIITQSTLKIKSVTVVRINHQSINEDSESNQSNKFIEQIFDENGNKTKEIIFDDIEQPEQISHFEFGDNNNLTCEKHHFVQDEIFEKTSFIYQDNILVERVKDYSMGSYEKCVFTYNDQKLISSIILINENNEEEDSEFFTYENKNLIHVIKKNALIGKEYELWLKYDANNLLMEEKKWDNSDGKTNTTIYDYTKSITEPDIKILNKKGEVIEAHRKNFDANGRMIQSEIQTAFNGLKKQITTYHYDEVNRLIFLETVDAKNNLERRVASEYDENGFLKSEVKTEFDISASAIVTFTLYYNYTLY